MLKIINSAETGILQTFGKVTRTLPPGLKFYIPLAQKITVISNRIRPLDFKFQIKTKDNVFAHLKISVQLRIDKDNSEKAFLNLSDPTAQINSYVENSIRSNAPTITIDELFLAQDKIRNFVIRDLSDRMSKYGYDVVDVLVTDIQPHSEVVDSMNKINASERLKEAAKNTAEANYITKVREAEADRDRKRLQGEGIAQQRSAILNGYESSITEMAETFGLTSKDIIEFVTKTQYMDMMENIGKSPNTKTIFVNSNPGNLKDLIRDTLVEAAIVNKK